MDVLHVNPILGHITTFGANPVITAAALQTLKIVLGSKIMESTLSKEKLLRLSKDYGTNEYGKYLKNLIS